MLSIVIKLNFARGSEETQKPTHVDYSTLVVHDTSASTPASRTNLTRSGLNDNVEL